MAALTTISSSIFLLFCQILVFARMGIIVIIATGASLIFAILFFACLLSGFGPPPLDPEQKAGLRGLVENAVFSTVASIRTMVHELAKFTLDDMQAQLAKQAEGFEGRQGQSQDREDCSRKEEEGASAEDELGEEAKLIDEEDAAAEAEAAEAGEVAAVFNKDGLTATEIARAAASLDCDLQAVMSTVSGATRPQVTFVEPWGKASLAGIKPGWRLIGVNDTKATSLEHARALIDTEGEESATLYWSVASELVEHEQRVGPPPLTYTKEVAVDFDAKAPIGVRIDPNLFVSAVHEGGQGQAHGAAVGWRLNRAARCRPARPSCRGDAPPQAADARKSRSAGSCRRRRSSSSTARRPTARAAAAWRRRRPPPRARRPPGCRSPASPPGRAGSHQNLRRLTSRASRPPMGTSERTLLYAATVGVLDSSSCRSCRRSLSSSRCLASRPIATPPKARRRRRSRTSGARRPRSHAKLQRQRQRNQTPQPAEVQAGVCR